MTRKAAFFERRSWFNLNNLGLALRTNLKFLKLKVRKFWSLILTFVEVTGEKLVGGAFLIPLHRILNRVKNIFSWKTQFYFLLHADDILAVFRCVLRRFFIFILMPNIFSNLCGQTFQFLLIDNRVWTVQFSLTDLHVSWSSWL